MIGVSILVQRVRTKASPPVAFCATSVETLQAELDKLDSWEIPWLLIPTEELPGRGNLRTEWDQLVMSLRGDTYDTVQLRWICYMKSTDVELRTFNISSEDIDRWLVELEQGDHHAETATRSRP